MSKTRTPGHWFVRTLAPGGKLKDCFVAAKDFTGKPYDAEILGDDEYHDGIERKLADCEWIVEACNNHDSIKQENAALREALADMLAGWVYIRQNHGDLYGVGWDRCESSAREALKVRP